MARTKSISHPYSLLSGVLHASIVFWVLLCTCTGLRAQNITAVYDPKTEVLTIDNQRDIVKLISTENMPSSLQKSIGDSCKIEKGRKFVVENVRNEEMEGYGAVVVYLRDANGNYSLPSAVPIRIKPEAVPPAPQPEPAFSLKSLFHTYTAVFIAGCVVIALIILLLLLRLLLKKREGAKNRRMGDGSRSVMQVVGEEKHDFEVGLDYVRNDLDNFYTLNMDTFFKDTAVEKVYLSREVIKKINRYFKAFLDDPERTRETGCYLIGCWERIKGSKGMYNVSIEEMVVPGDDVVPGEYSLNFGLKIGIDLGSTIRNLCEKTNRDYVHIAWMHSHPGLGLFLSTHDIVVQKQLTYPDEPKRMLAIVIDTNTPDWNTAFFVSKNNGKMNNKEDLLQTISFDTLKEWSRHKTVTVSAPRTAVSTNRDSTFSISSEDDSDIFLFNSRVINQMDDQMDADISDEDCFFHAQLLQAGGKKHCMITACDTFKSDDVCGILALDLDNPDDFDANQYSDRLETYDFCVIYRSDQQCYLIYRNAQQEINALPLSLKEMKEWTRRKRI